MKQLPLIQIGNLHLRDACSKFELAEITTNHTKDVIKGLKYTLNKIGGVGLAAPQVSIQKRLFVLGLAPTKFRPDILAVKPYAVFNPSIIWQSKELASDWEGCFSVAKAGLFGQVKRSDSIKVTYLNEQAIKVTKNLYGLEARVFMHEYDHLQGLVFLDRNPDVGSFMSANEYKLMRASAKAKK